MRQKLYNIILEKGKEKVPGVTKKLFKDWTDKYNPYKPGRMSSKDPQEISGRYWIIDPKTRKRVYGGISNNIGKRKNEHIRTGKLDPKKHILVWSPKKKSAEYNDLRKQEKRDIARHQPNKNKNRGGGGRSPNKKK